MAMLAIRREGGLEQAARLLHALGPQAAQIWQQLDADETRQLGEMMARLPAEAHHADTALVSAFVGEVRRQSAPGAARMGSGSLWDRLSAMTGGQLAGLLENEPAQILALVAVRLDTRTSAQFLGALSRARAVDTILRMVRTSPVHRDALALIEAEIGERLKAGATRPDRSTQLAGILDRVPADRAREALDALAAHAPDDAGRIRALMFCFDDLVRLDPAGVQTLLMAVDRSVLAIALRGAERVTKLFLQNMTQRARDQLQADMAGTGALRRDEVSRARDILMEDVRQLIDRGELSVSRDQNPDGLVE